MAFATYADLLRLPAVRRILLLGLVVRVPLWAANVVLTLHIVTHLDRSYSEAGLIAAVQAITLGVSGPYRGRRLDQLGLRRAIAPSLGVLLVCCCVAPWVGYWPLLVCAGLAGLFTVPSFSIVRTVLIGSVSEQQRTSALSIDAVATELTFMVGPVLGVLLATAVPTPLALFLCQLATLIGAALIWLVDPPLRGADDAATGSAGHASARAWMTPAVFMIMAISVVATITLTSEDLSTVAALREWDHPSSIGWVLALWGAGSAVGGIVYGALHRHPPASVLLVFLAGSTALVAVAPDRTWFTVLLFVSGIFCAPTVTATADDLSRAVPAAHRGEAMGWHGSAMMVGSAVGAPLIGIALDLGGWQWGLLSAGLTGLAIALAGLLVIRNRASGAVATESVPATVAGTPLTGSGGAVATVGLTQPVGDTPPVG